MCYQPHFDQKNDENNNDKPITLTGSSNIVTEFLGLSIYRGIYPADDFESVKKFGVSMLISTNKKLKEYLSNVLSQLNEWLMTKEIQKLVLVITGLDTNEILERWVFDVKVDDENKCNNTNNISKNKSIKEISSEIQAIIRQITASNTFLPIIDQNCTFDLLVYTNSSTEIPISMEISDPKYIDQSSEVKLRSFATTMHQINTAVSYRA